MNKFKIKLLVQCVCDAKACVVAACVRCVNISCHIPSSKRQQDAADYEKGRRGGVGREALFQLEGRVDVCPSLQAGNHV